MAVVCGCGKQVRMSLCSKCIDLKPFTVFRYNPDCEKSGDEDKCCGYFYGSGASTELVNKKVK